MKQALLIALIACGMLACGVNNQPTTSQNISFDTSASVTPTNTIHHWFEADQLQARIDDYQQRNDKPIMLQEVGYHSWADAPHNQRDETGQADILGRVANVAETEDISGWVVWTAFDFVPKAGEAYNFEHFFGLWQTDLTPKSALETLPLQ